MKEKDMEARIKKWAPMLEEQARSGLNKDDWCKANGISRTAFFKWQRETRSYMLANNLKMPSISNGYFQTEPTFIDITPKAAAPAVAGNGQETLPCSVRTTPVTELSIRYGGFSVELNEITDERLLTMALRVISNVK